MSDNVPLTMAITDSPTVDVCVFEDDRNTREFIARFLKDENINVQTCPLGWQAHLCIRNNRPKVVIFDVRVPDVDGIQLFYLLRGDETTAGIPVIFLTASPEKVRHELPNYDKMNAVMLSKPFNLQDLLDLVQAKLAA